MEDELEHNIDYTWVLEHYINPIPHVFKVYPPTFVHLYGIIEERIYDANYH